MFANPNLALRENNLKWFAAIWSIVIIAPLVYFPAPSLLFGHPWKVELVISFVLFLTLIICLLFRRAQDGIVSLSPQIVLYIIAPCCAFILWSAVSAVWADSTLSVVHHTLVWSGYLIFFLFALRIVSSIKLLQISLITLGAVLSVICLCCIFEFVFEENINQTFGSRYGRYSEIFAALLPLFFSLVLRLKRKHLLWAALATLLLWFGLLFAMSRGSLLAAIAGLAVFIGLRLFTNKTSVEKKRLIAAAAALIFAALLIQIPFRSSDDGQKGSTFSRIKISDEKDAGNSFSQNVRLLFLGVGKEMFVENYLTGVGADNFGSRYNQYRDVYSANPANKTVAKQQEELIPERAHNEYLQVLAELGVVGAAIFLLMLGGIAKLGITDIFKNRHARGNVLTHAAVGGIVAFLASSMVSSYSFRLVQNGLVFFFLLAILLRNFVAEKNREKQAEILIAPRLKTVFAVIALFACLSLSIFSALKAAGQYFVYRAESEKNFAAAEIDYEKATRLDSANAAANFSFGMRLLDEEKYRQSAEQLQQAVAKGINDSISYSYLITAQTLADQPEQAIKTSAEAVEVFPYSVFMRVRYAALLDKFQQPAEAAKQFEIARQIDEKQSETWRLLINQGSFLTSRETLINDKISKIDELKPEQAVYAVLTERQIIHPEEKPQFNFAEQTDY